jgi:hypothetical protein
MQAEGASSPPCLLRMQEAQQKQSNPLLLRRIALFYRLLCEAIACLA